MSIEQVKNELQALLQNLLQIGFENPEMLMFLSNIVASEVPEADRYTLLTKMFEEVPPLLTHLLNSPDQFMAVLQDPPADAVTLRLFLEFRELSELFSSLSIVQLIQFSNNILPPGDASVQLQYFMEMQRLLVRWSQEQLSELHRVLSTTPLTMERSELLQRVPDIPIALIHLIVELLKLPLSELLSLQTWCANAPQTRVVYLVHLLQHEAPVLLQLRQALVPSLVSTSSLAAPSTVKAPPPLELNNNNNTVHDDDDVPPPAVQRRRTSATTSQTTRTTTRVKPTSVPVGDEPGPVGAGSDGLSVRLAQEPPVETVYNRILKPYPAVAVAGVGRNNGTNLFVAAVCVSADTLVEVALCLCGTTRVKLTASAHAQFKKLKLAFTSQQQGTDFRLRFHLQKYSSSGFQDVAEAYATSRAITVYSHTQYLTRNTGSSSSGAGNNSGATSSSSSTNQVVINELIPVRASAGSKLCVLGANFVRSDRLRVRIGEHIVVPQFHESGTLVCVVPPCHTQYVTVAVSNNNKAWSEQVTLEIA